VSGDEHILVCQDTGREFSPNANHVVPIFSYDAYTLRWEVQLMRMNSWNPMHFVVGCCLAVFAIFVNSTSLQAQNGTWTSTVDGLWSAPGSWAGGTVADGANNTANFNTLDIQDQTGATTFPAVGVQLDSPRTIGHMIFGDTNAATPGAWDLFTLTQATNILTLSDATKPSITVNPLGPVGTPPQDSARVLVNLAGANGFTKLGTGVLAIGGTNPNLTGNIDVNAGKLRIAAAATFDFETAVTPASTRFNLANGAEIETAASIAANSAAGGITLASGSTATITNTATNSIFFGNVSGAGATLNFDIATGGTLTTSIDRDWAQNGALAAVNFRGLQVGSQSQVRIRNNGGTFNFNSFGSTTVNLNNVMLFTNTNSGGNTNNIGALTGTSTGTLQGGAAGSVVTYVIGGLNSNTNFAGAVTTGNGLNLFKVGTGTMELSGTLSYAPTNNAILNRRGGTTRIEAGTLKLSGPAAIPGGSFDAVQGDLISTVDVRAGATLDVSATTTPYSTASRQQVIGAGTIVGNYTHDEGTLAPGDTNVGGNTQTLTSVPGTFTFANNLSFVGSGAIAFNLANTPAGSNDLIQVNGTADLSGTPSITPSFASGFPTAGQTYTLLNATGGFGGSTPSGWVVNWPGRNPVAPSVFTMGNSVKITATPIVIHSLNWSGAVDATWNTSTANWFDNDVSAAGTFVEFDRVTFADTFNGGIPVANATVNLPGVVNPSSVTVDSTATTYTIAGTGRIAGNTSLIKRGSSRLNLTGANTYIGGTTIEGGSLDLGPAGQAGSGVITLAGGALHAGEAANFTLPNAIQVNGSGNVISNDNNASQTLNLNGNISGTGSLALQNNSIGNGIDPPVINGVDIFGNNTGFSGSISVGGPTPVFARFRTDGSEGNNAAWDLGNIGSVLAATVGANTVFQIGSLTGGTLSRVSGHESSGGVGSSTYEVGALGTSTTFSGAIMNGRTDLNVGNFTALTKVGAGTLTLDNMVDPNLADTITLYSGDTRIKEGTLSIAQAFLADTSDVYIGAGSVFNLNTLGATDIIDSLYLGNTPQNPGTYGAVGSGATFQSAFFSGTGILSVTTLGAPITTSGDFDNDGDVDGRDFLIWQRGGSPNGATAGDLAQWQANYGTTPLTAAVTASSTAVPEPGTMCLVTLAVLLGSSIRRRK
jgi:fibronectin-binding autotransporter adhesin